MGRYSRRTVLKIGGAATAAGLLPSLASRRAAAQGKPVKLGFLAPISGGMEVMGRPLLDGAQIAVEQINKVGGLVNSSRLC